MQVLTIAADLRLGPEVLPAIASLAALEQGWNAVATGDYLTGLMLPDQDSGLAAAAAAHLGGRWADHQVRGAWGQPESGSILFCTNSAEVPCAVIEPGYLSRPRRAAQPLDRASSYGLGQLLRAARSGGAQKIIVALGPSHCHDGGAGVLAALGLTSPFLSQGPSALGQLEPADFRELAQLRADWADIELVLATGHSVPLLGLSGASATQAQARGASARQSQEFERALGHFSYLAQGAIAGQPLLGRGLAGQPGSGAAGGIGFSLYLLGARYQDPVTALAEMSKIEDKFQDPELVLVTCAELDWQSLSVGPVAWAGEQATSRGVPAVVLAARCAVGRRELSSAGIATAYTCGPVGPDSQQSSAADFLAGLYRRAGRLARSWSPAR